MKKKISVLLVLTALLLLFGGIVPLQAKAPRKVTGGAQWLNTDTGELAFFSEYNVHEVGDGPAATGWVQWRVPDPDGGWLPMTRVYAICVGFGEYEGHSAASYVVFSPDYMDVPSSSSGDLMAEHRVARVIKSCGFPPRIRSTPTAITRDRVHLPS